MIAKQSRLPTEETSSPARLLFGRFAGILPGGSHHPLFPGGDFKFFEQLLAEVLAHESAPVEDREAAYLAALGRFGEMADGSRRGTELLEQGAERFLCFCRGHDSGGSVPYRGQNCKVLRPGSVGFPEDGGDFLRGMVEHIERFGEHHAGNAEGVANVR